MCQKKKIMYFIFVTFLQLSGEPNSSASHKLVEQLQNEKAELESKLEQVRFIIQCIFGAKTHN